MRVLIVEDDDSIRNVMTELLHQMGHTCYGVRDEAEGAETLPLLKPEVVLLDLLIRGHISTPFIDIARKLTPGSPPRVIIVSALQGAKNIANAERVEFLAKPFDIEKLEALIHRPTPSQQDQVHHG